MPSSSYQTIALVLEQVLGLTPPPRTILDLGTGCGKWGVLLREYLEVAAGHLELSARQVHLTGVELERRYRWAQDHIYDVMHWGGIQEFLAVAPPTARWDLALLLDVLEHLDQDPGRQVLLALQARCRNILVLLPAYYFANRIVGYETEQHRSHWELADFVALGFDAWDRDPGARLALWRAP
jgi:hypothetical protein